MIYTVTVKAPAINEEIVLSADSEEQAKQMAIASALRRQIEAAEVTVVLQPAP